MLEEEKPHGALVPKNAEAITRVAARGQQLPGPGLSPTSRWGRAGPGDWPGLHPAGPATGWLSTLALPSAVKHLPVSVLRSRLFAWRSSLTPPPCSGPWSSRLCPLLSGSAVSRAAPFCDLTPGLLFFPGEKEWKERIPSSVQAESLK